MIQSASAGVLPDLYVINFPSATAEIVDGIDCVLGVEIEGPNSPSLNSDAEIASERFNSGASTLRTGVGAIVNNFRIVRARLELVSSYWD
ncbi:hypothetical protein M8J76_002006 [Diaphorina citri]|nr:hypothetical protein M8J75_003463 [Diaphorina citri]KAI5702421.1 hypothetical protein M8J76_011602 [Diaphorina citri]KAI5708729.1 hypothetical protein M8J76_002006 [Diaphorina citri]